MALRLFPNEQNFIKFILTNQCARPWFVYLETFVPAFIKLLITVVLFDIEDAIRQRGEELVREKGGGKGKRHSPRIKTSGQQTAAQRWTQKGLKTILVVTKPLEKIGFNWLLYSAVDEFFYDWQTLLEQSLYCETSINWGPLTRKRGPGPISIVVGFIPVIMTSLEQNRSGWEDNVLGTTVPLGKYHSFFALTVVGPIGGVTNVKIRLRTPGSFGPDVTESDPLALANGEAGDLVVSHDFHFPLIGGGTLTWEIGGETIPAGILTVKGFMTVYRRA